VGARRDLVLETAGEIGDSLQRLYAGLTRDAKTERRKERAWALLNGVTATVFTIAARQALIRLWPILTGEEPPLGRRDTTRKAPETQTTVEPPSA
jgi:hypothetical protein